MPLIKKEFCITKEEFAEIDEQISKIKSQLRLGFPEDGGKSPLNPKLVSISLSNIIDPRFELIRECRITVPPDYNHKIQLATLNQENFTFIHNDITDDNFKLTSHKLKANNKYIVKLFHVNNKENVQTQDVIEFLNKNNALFVSAQGLSLLWQIKNIENDFFPYGYWIISFDIESNLFKDSEDRTRLTNIYRNSKGYSFNLDFFDRKIYTNLNITASCIVFFTEDK